MAGDEQIFIEMLATQEGVLLRMRVVVDGNLTTGGYVLKGTAPELSALEENVGIRSTRVVDERQHQVDAVSVIVFDFSRQDRCGIGDKLILASALRPPRKHICPTHHAVELSCQIQVDGRSSHLFNRLSYIEGRFQRIAYSLVFTPSLGMIITMCLQLRKHLQVCLKDGSLLDPKEQAGEGVGQRSYVSVVVLNILQHGALILVVSLPGKCLAFLARRKKDCQRFCSIIW